MRKYFVWGTVAAIILAAIAIGYASITPTWDNLLNIGTFAVITMTLAALIIYTNDTNRLAQITQLKWERETLLSATYVMVGQNDKGGSGIIQFILNNPSTLIIRAKVWAEFKVYGIKVDSGDPYNGTDTWILFPQQGSQGWYSIEDLVRQQGKTIAQMQTEFSPQNETRQLTLDLTIEFRDERGIIRKLPTRRHYFSFQRWTWIPVLTRKDDLLWEKG